MGQYFEHLIISPARPRRVRFGSRVVVQSGEAAVLFRHGRVEGPLGAGAHRQWRTGLSVRVLDVRPSLLTVPTQEVPTRDGVTIKVTAVGVVTVVDPVDAVLAASDTRDLLYLAVQVAVREVVAERTIDELLEGRPDLGAAVHGRVRHAEATGLALDRVEVKDIVLPPELRRAQAQVLLARAEGQAALERARGETAALRSLANAARLAEEHPALLQLRLVQQLGGSEGHTVVVQGPTAAA